LEVDGDINVLVTVALKLKAAKVRFWRGIRKHVWIVRAFWPLPFDLRESVRLQALGAVKVDGDGFEEVREHLGPLFSLWLLRWIISILLALVALASLKLR